jgi:hypothetical protein
MKSRPGTILGDDVILFAHIPKACLSDIDLIMSILAGLKPDFLESPTGPVGSASRS